MNTLSKLMTVSIAMTVSANVLAFDIHTHAAMTSEAIKQSKITGAPNDSVVLKKLGLYDKDYVFKVRYIDIGSSLNDRNATLFESGVMERVREKITDIPNPHTIPGWIIRGAIREDDNTIETPPGTPQGDEPGGVFQRSFAHFFDPQNDRPLTLAGERGPRSPDWALVAGTLSSGRENRYNIPSAREAMWRALTLKKRLPNGTLESILPGGNNVGAAAAEDERNAYWATTFRAVGDVVHLLQDAAQPQHTRNDAHAGLGCDPRVFQDTCLAGHDSFVEKYLKARTLRATSFTLVEGVVPFLPTWELVKNTKQLDQLRYEGYPTPSFAKYRDYFSTGTGGGNASGQGLANYSNRGFYSFGTNIGSIAATSFPSPSPTGSGLGDELLANENLRDIAGNVVSGVVKFKVGVVQDTLFPDKTTPPTIRLSARGFFDQFLQSEGFSAKYTLNHYNYNDQADLLVPRAVAYSAGLIDYFFRGELEISLPDDGVYAVVDYAINSNKNTGGFDKVKLKLTNKTPSITPSGGGATVVQNLDPSGIVVAIAKFRRNKCYIENTLQGEIPVLFKAGKTVQEIYDECRAVAEEIVVSDPAVLPSGLALDATVPLTFNFRDRIPVNVMDLVLQVVYRGPLGDETDAVVVTTKDVSEPTFFKLTNYIWTKIVSNGSCTFNEYGGTRTTSRMKIALNEIPGAPFLIEADLSETDYAMFAAISDIAQVKSRGEYLMQGSASPITLGTTTLYERFHQEAQRATDGTGDIVIPFYRQSEFYPTAPNTLTLRNSTKPAFVKIRGMFIDTGFYVDNRDDLSSCTANPTKPYWPTEGHALMQPHNPLVPRALFKVNF